MKKFVFLVISLGMLSLSNSEPYPHVSIITSVYNGDAFIKGFMEDVTRQTVFGKKDSMGHFFCELILIDANSPGNEIKIIRPYLKKHKNIIYRRLIKDPGIYGVWNIAIKMAKGRYITNANLDDRLAPNCIEVFSSYLDAHPDIDFVYSDNYWTPTPNQTLEERHKYQAIWKGFLLNRGMYWGSERDFSPEALMNWKISGNHPIWRKTLHDRFGLFDARLKRAGDWEMWCRAFSGGAKFKKIPGVYGSYYFNPSGLSTQSDASEDINREISIVYNRYFDEIL
jgi:glycosyltransferase involved in cell wall biosynthesis